MHLKQITNLINTFLNGKKENIIISLDEYEFLNSKKNIKGKSYSYELVKTLLDKYFINIEKLYKGNNSSIIIYLKGYSNKKYFEIILDSTLNYIEILDFLFKNNMLDKNQIKKYKKLKTLVDYKLYFKNVINNRYEFYYLQEKKTIKI